VGRTASHYAIIVWRVCVVVTGMKRSVMKSYNFVSIDHTITYDTLVTRSDTSSK